MLWLSAVDQESNIDIGVVMGLSANGVAALARRARRGFRLAYVQAHLSGPVASAECAEFVAVLVAMVAEGTHPPLSALCHAALCDPCSARLDDLIADPVLARRAV